MSDEFVDFAEIGTITVGFDDQTWTLRRPKMGQWKWFQRRLREMGAEVAAELAKLTEAAQAAVDAHEAKPTPKRLEEAEAAQEALTDFAQVPFYERTSEWVREAFVQLGDRPLPDDRDEWPAWLAVDTSFPVAIVDHWKKRPKASGSARLTQTEPG